MPLVSAGISWVVAWFTARRIALRSARKQAFLDLLEYLDDLEEAAQALFLAAGDSPEADALFRNACLCNNRLGRRISEVFLAHPSKARLAGRDPVPPQVGDALFGLRKIAIADELVAPGRSACTGNDPRFQTLTTSVERLRLALRTEAEDMKAGDLQP